MALIKRMQQVYSSGDVTVTFLGIYNINPSSIEYNYTYEHEYQRGLRREPRGWRMGSKQMDGKITLPLDEVSKIERISPNGDIARIKPFPIVITFFNDENLMIKDIITVKFKGNGRVITSDGELEKELELFIIDINLNII